MYAMVFVIDVFYVLLRFRLTKDIFLIITYSAKNLTPVEELRRDIGTNCHNERKCAK